VADLIEHIEGNHERLDVLVNDIFGGTATPSETSRCGSTT